MLLVPAPVVASQSANISGILRLPRSNSGSMCAIDDPLLRTPFEISKIMQLKMQCVMQHARLQKQTERVHGS